MLAGTTYATVGAELGVSRQRVGQMVERARRTPSPERPPPSRQRDAGATPRDGL